MLVRHIWGYLPSLIIPSLVTFISVFVYTRILSTEEFGRYALTLTTMYVINAFLFYWLPISLPRFLPRVQLAHRVEKLRATIYITFIAMSGALLLAALILGTMGGYTIVWLVVPLCIARSLLNVNLAFHRSNLDFRRYAFVECSQAILGFFMSLMLIYWFHLGIYGVFAGMLMGMVFALLIDIRGIATLSTSDFSVPLFKEICAFGIPLMLVALLGVLLALSDRFLIGHIRGLDEVGIYAAGYTLMDRIMAIAFLVVATPSFPITLRIYEEQGKEATDIQLRQSASVMLALVLPACAGIILCHKHLAALIIGADFRDGAAAIMPYIALSALFGGLATHYFDHAFHIARKTKMLFYTQGPAVMLNLGLNLILITLFGYKGAAIANVFSYGLLLLLSVTLGRSLFRIDFPLRQALQISGCVAVMVLVVNAVSFPLTVPGLVAMITMGAAIYIALLLAFNVIKVRSHLREWMMARGK